MRLIGRLLIAIFLALVVIIATAWAVGALWYQLPVRPSARVATAFLYGFFGLATIVALFTKLRNWLLLLFILCFVLLLTWWSTIKPLEHAD